LESDELAQLAIAQLGAEVQRRGMEWLHLPIPDVSTPDPEFEAKWPTVSNSLRSRLDAGENILVHCCGGLGRAGMISARLLAESGRRTQDCDLAGSRRSTWGDRDMGTRAMGEDGAATRASSVTGLLDALAGGRSL
jgi:protein-tyrosine phosphatase